MKTSLGFFDAVFGKRMSLEFPMPDGTTKTVKVTEKWLAKMESEEKVKNVSDRAVLVHTIEKLPSLPGDERFVEGEMHWVIGQDIQEQEYAKLRDENGELFAFILPEDCDSPRLSDSGGRLNHAARTGAYSASN